MHVVAWAGSAGMPHLSLCKHLALNMAVLLCQILLPQRLYILRSKAAFLPIGVISLAESKPLLDASGRTIHFKVLTHACGR